MSTRDRLLLAGGAAAVLACATLGAGSSTYAGFSDFGTRHVDVGAGIWTPDPPAACGALSQYSGIVWGTPGKDDLNGGNQRQVIMGMGGNDTIHGGNSGDCLVGGDGDDQLYGGNAKDILIGDNGDDHLDGGNGKDYLDGGGGIDECLGGNGVDTLHDCEGSVPPTQLTLLEEHVTADLGSTDAPPKPPASTTSAPTTVTPEPATEPPAEPGAASDPPSEPDPATDTATPDGSQPDPTSALAPSP